MAAKNTRSAQASRLGITGACLLLPAVLAQVGGAQTPSGGLALDRPHPRLLLDSNGVVALKQRIDTMPGAKASWAELRARAEKALARDVALPPRGGNWSHNYVCPTHGARLAQGRQLGPWQWEHICPVGRHALHGDPSKATLDFDGNAISGLHSGYAQQVVDAGLVFQVTGEARYAARARAILLAYANGYLNYELHDNQGNPGRGGRVTSQSLSEASWLIEMTQGADLVWTKLSDEDRRIIATSLLRPALDQVILPRRLGIHNIQCRHNSAIGLVGFLLGDPKLIAAAIDDPEVGFRQQIEKGVLADGLWLEGSGGYHFFTVAGLWPLAEAARNCGLDLYDAKFRSMFDGPISLAMPNLALPDFNDSGIVPLKNQGDLYELAFARYGNPAYVPLLAAGARQTHLALLFGVRNLPASNTVPLLGSHNSTASGYAILQRGHDADATWVGVKYGPHGGGHGHPDKNTFILYEGGRIVVTDAGTHAYGSSLHRDWDKTTVAHNTLVVDETSQVAASGGALAFGSDKGVDYSITDAGPIYEGVSFTRTVALVTPQLILFVDQVRSRSAHTYDIACHPIGRWEGAEGTWAIWAPHNVPGYKHLSQTRARELEQGNLTVRTESSRDRRIAITIAANDPTQLISGYGILKTTEDLVPVLLQRRQARTTAFVWAISLSGSPVILQLSSATDASGTALSAAEVALIRLDDEEHHWSVLVNPFGKTATVGLPSGPPQVTNARFAVY